MDAKDFEVMLLVVLHARDLLGNVTTGVTVSFWDGIATNLEVNKH